MRLRNKKRIIITLLIVLGIMVMIFYFSSKVREDSDGMSRGIARFLLPLFEKLSDLFGSSDSSAGSSSLSLTGGSMLDDLNYYIRKMGHLSEFALLGGALMLHADSVSRYMEKLRLKTDALIAVSVSILYAISDEVHQIFVQGRGPGVKDVFIDSTGAVIGCMIVLFVLARKNKKKRTKRENDISETCENGCGAKG